MDEGLVIAHCKRHDKRAQKELFESLAGKMMLLCIRYVKNHHDAEELLLNGFSAFFKNIGKFEYRGPGSLQAWISKIMVNECLMFLRKQGRIRFIDEGHADEAATSTNTIDDISAKELFRLVESLPDGYRTVFNLYAIEGFSHKEIGKLLNIQEGTSKSQFSKARKLLQIKLSTIKNTKWNGEKKYKN